MSRTLILLALLTYSVSAAQQPPTEPEVVHGTINVTLGNRNGIVVLTDSMLTSGGRQLPDPGQKLFKLDERTVCAIAGFYSAGTAIPVPDLYANTAAIIHEYIRRSAEQRPQTIDEKVKALALVFNLYLSIAANVLGSSDPTPYEFQLTVAGYDLDGKPKIEKITLKTKADQTHFWSGVDKVSVTNVEDRLERKLGGICDVAEQLLERPDIKPNDVALRQYAASMRRNYGRALTRQQMTRVAEQLKYYTSKKYPGVGGESQVAVLERGHIISFKQQPFRELPRPPLNFRLVVNWVSNGNAMSDWPVFSGQTTVCIRCEWSDEPRAIDGFYFIGSSFTNCRLRYDEGPVDLGDAHVTNSELVIGRDAEIDSTAVQRLLRFQWKAVKYEWPRRN
jgi:hypothetical protein